MIKNEVKNEKKRKIGENRTESWGRKRPSEEMKITWRLKVLWLVYVREEQQTRIDGSKVTVG